MNRILRNPFEADYPEYLERELAYGIALVVAFNRTGALLATGCADGRVVVWDTLTGVAVRDLFAGGHTRAVTSVAFSARRGTHLLSTAMDWSAALWDVASGEVLRLVRLGAPIVAGALGADAEHFSLLTSANELYRTGRDAASPVSRSSAAPDVVHAMAARPPAMRVLYAATSGGRLLAFDARSQAPASLTTLPTTTATVKQLVFSKRGNYLLVNSSDKYLRLYAVVDEQTGALAFERNFVDLVNRFQWKCATFSGNDEADYVVGGSANKSNQKIYVWSRPDGALIKILEHAKCGSLHLAWHPRRAVLASAATSGAVQLWGTVVAENWSAFAPDFQELEENVEYVEKEDEFDDFIDDAPNVPAAKVAATASVAAASNDDDVDIVVDEDAEDSDAETLHLPTIPEPDETALVMQFTSNGSERTISLV